MKKILVIDDSDLVSQLLKSGLTDAGYDVSVAADANQGYSLAVELQPDLILLDVQLPDVNGHNLIGILKNREDLKDIPIIMITGTHHQTEHKVKAFQAGADDYVLKPFEMPELIERVAAVLRRSQKVPIAKPASIMVPQPTPVAKAVPKPEPVIILEAPKPQPSVHAPSEPAVYVAPEPLPLTKACRIVLLQPESYPFDRPYPAASLAFLIASLTLGYVGLACAAHSGVSAAVLTLVILLAWVALVSVLVMASSVIGITLSWKEGARLFSLAALPLLLKLGAGDISSLWTSLSPFYFSASPALFLKTPSFLLERLDLFELWSLGLIWFFVSKRPAATRQRATTVTALVWLTALAIMTAAQKLGS